MITWWQSRSTREHWLLGMGTGLVLVLILYGLAWQPFAEGLEQLRQEVAVQRTDLAWMRQTSLEVKRLDAISSRPVSPARRTGNRSLLTLVDQTARTAGLGKAVKRVGPQGNDAVRVRLEQVNFDDMIVWLDSLEREHGIGTANGVVDRQNNSGFVNARFILKRTTP